MQGVGAFMPRLLCALSVSQRAALGKWGWRGQELGPLMDSALMEDPETAQVAE